MLLIEVEVPHLLNAFDLHVTHAPGINSARLSVMIKTVLWGLLPKWFYNDVLKDGC